MDGEGTDFCISRNVSWLEMCLGQNYWGIGAEGHMPPVLPPPPPSSSYTHIFVCRIFLVSQQCLNGFQWKP